MALYYALHPPQYASAIAQSIATALKTLIVGMAFLATFSFAFIALGLTWCSGAACCRVPHSQRSADGKPPRVCSRDSTSKPSGHDFHDLGLLVTLLLPGMLLSVLILSTFAPAAGG
jgi:hypothetical protein